MVERKKIVFVSGVERKEKGGWGGASGLRGLVVVVVGEFRWRWEEGCVWGGSGKERGREQERWGQRMSLAPMPWGQSST